MKKRIFKAMWLSVMAVAVVTVSSCSSDSDFFGLDGLEDVDIFTNPSTINQSELLELANSCPFYITETNEYITYINSFDNLFNAINDSIESKYNSKSDLDPLRKALIVNYEILINKYPEYKSLTVAGKELLRHHFQKSNSNIKNQKRTKNRSVESCTAYNALNKPMLDGLIIDAGIYCYQGIYMQIFNSSDAVTAAIIYTITEQVEFGGLGYGDSSILMIDPNAGPYSMKLVFINNPNYSFNYAFHVHPVMDISSYIYLNDADEASRQTCLNTTGCSDFRVYDWSNNYHSFSGRHY